MKRRHGEDHDLGAPDVHPERGRGQLAVADGGELPAEPAAADHADQHGRARRTPRRTTRRTRRRSCVEMPRTSGRPTVSPARPKTRGSPSTTSRPMSAMPNVLSARCRPRSRTDGRATTTPSTAATSAAEQHAEHAVAAEELAGDERADAEEEVLRERDLARQPGDGHQRQRDRRHDQRPDEVGAAGRRARALHERATTPTTSADAGDDERAQRRAPRGWSRPDNPSGRQPERRHEQHGERRGRCRGWPGAPGGRRRRRARATTRS